MQSLCPASFSVDLEGWTWSPGLDLGPGRLSWWVVTSGMATTSMALLPLGLVDSL